MTLTWLSAVAIRTETLLKLLTIRMTCFFPFIFSYAENISIVRHTVILAASQANSFNAAFVRQAKEVTYVLVMWYCVVYAAV